jgi:hypothetical protein
MEYWSIEKSYISGTKLQGNFNFQCTMIQAALELPSRI